MAPRHSVSYFKTGPHKMVDPTESLTMYDRLHDKTPEDFRKIRSYDLQSTDIWNKIYEQNKLHSVPVTMSHWYGWPDVQIDRPSGTFFRTRTIQDNFYRRKDVNVPPTLDAAE